MQKLGVKDTVEIALKSGATGEIVDYRVEDLIVNVGKAKVAALIGGVGSVSPFGYIALGTLDTAPSASDTALAAEVTRASSTNSLTTTSTDNDTLQAVASFTFTNSYGIKESGLFNASSGGDMLCRTTFGVVNVTSGDSLQLTYKIQIS